MCTYLAKRNSVYYFRRVIPIELRPALGGRREFMKSLGTKDRAEAKKLIPAHASASERELEIARGSLASAQNSSVSASPVISARAARQEADYLEWMEECTAFQEQMDDEREELEEALEPVAAEITKRLEAPLRTLDPSDAAIKLLLMERDQEVEALKLRLGSVQHREQKEPELASVPPSAAIAHQPVAARSPTLLYPDIVELWSAERSVQEKSKDASAAVARWFYERVGYIPVAEITRRNVLEFKDKLKGEGQSDANINAKLSKLRALLQWAHDNDHAVGNVAAGIKVRDVAGPADKRKVFDLTSLNAVFRSPVYSEGFRPTRGRGEAAYWLPLLALFTGARLEELGQLRLVDVKRISFPDDEGKMQDGWFISITSDPKDGLKLKTASSERIVPIHAALIGLGFIDYIDGAKATGHSRVFYDLKPGAYGRLTAKWGEWFGDYLRNICGITDTRIVFHSFRHTFKDYCREASIEDGVQRQLMGHSKGDVADGYGTGFPVHRLVSAMCAYRVPGLVLPDRPLQLR